MAKELWEQKIKKTGELRRYFGVEEGETIPMNKLNALISRLRKKAEGEGKLSKYELHLLRMAIAARNMREANK